MSLKQKVCNSVKFMETLFVSLKIHTFSCLLKNEIPPIMKSSSPIKNMLSLSVSMAGLSVFNIADAAPFYINTSNSTPGAADLKPSSTDLVNQGQPTLASPYTSSTTPNFGAGTVNNGKAAKTTSDCAFYRTSNKVFPATLVFNLNISSNTLGYDITQIDSFAGWDGGGTQTQANQKFTVEYSVVGSDTWTSLASVDFNPFSNTNSNTPAYSQCIITDDSSEILVTGVDALRFVYNDPTISGGANGGTVLQEIDIHGVPTSTSKPSGPDVSAPPLVGSAIVDNRSGSPIEKNKIVTYTLTFSKDMNAATFSAADFGNAGTASVTIGRIQKTSPGVFSVMVMPTSTGTLQLQIPANATIADATGNRLVTTTAIVDDTILTVTDAVSQ
jgi:hypothetical protein